MSAEAKACNEEDDIKDLVTAFLRKIESDIQEEKCPNDNNTISYYVASFAMIGMEERDIMEHVTFILDFFKGLKPPKPGLSMIPSLNLAQKVDMDAYNVASDILCSEIIKGRVDGFKMRNGM